MSYLVDSPVAWDIQRKRPPTYQGNGEGWQGSICFRIAWDDVDAFSIFAAGTKETVVYSGGTMERIVPLRHPDYSLMMATDIRIEAMGGAGGSGPSVFSNTFSHALIDVTFSTSPFLVDAGSNDQPYMSTELRYGGQHHSLPGAAFKFPSDNRKVETDLGIWIPEVGYSITTYLNPDLNDTLIASLIGKINSAVFLGRPIKTMRFDGLNASFAQTVSFQTTFQKQFSFSYRAIPWGQRLRPDGTWEAPVNIASGDEAYLAADLNQLLR